MFQNLQTIARDQLFQLTEEFNSDPNPNKINLGIGIYLDDNSQNYIMPSILKASETLQNQNFNYTPIQGYKDFLQHSYTFLTDTEKVPNNQYIQATSGGTHACYIIAKLLQRNHITNLILPTPTWGNHLEIFSEFNQIQFPHLDSNEQINFTEYKNQIQSAPPNSSLLLHGGLAHNPTGLNINLSQLQEIIQLCNHHNVFLIQDFAYLGLSENLENDKNHLKTFLNLTHHGASLISFSKNATLYQHRTGLLIIKSQSNFVPQIQTNIENIVRKNISQSPAHGQKIISHLLQHHKSDWIQDLENMNQSLKNRQTLFHQSFPQLKLPQTSGMFCLLKLTTNQIQSLKQQSIYIPSNSRINYGSLTQNIINQLKHYFPI